MSKYYVYDWLGVETPKTYCGREPCRIISYVKESTDIKSVRSELICDGKNAIVWCPKSGRIKIFRRGCESVWGRMNSHEFLHRYSFASPWQEDTLRNGKSTSFFKTLD